jgi:predicted phosphate transport protein (TIGR00153 family)
MLLSWFEKRRKSKTLKLAQDQIIKAINTVTELDNALTAFSEGRNEAAEKCLERLFSEEEEIDELRRSVFTELTKGDLPPKYREDLKGLVEHLDIMADYVKDSARCLKILMTTRIPKEVLDSCLRISNALVECASALQNSIEMLGVDTSQAQELTNKVDIMEDHIDDEYLKAKILSIKYTKEIDCATLLILRDFTEFMERIADMCADTADHIRVLAIGEEET